MKLKIINRLMLVFIILVSLFSQVCKKKSDCPHTNSSLAPGLQSIYPERGSLVGTNITLSWSWIADFERGLIYTVHFGSSQADMPLIAIQTKDSLSLKDLIPGKTYYWSIFVSDECNPGVGTGIMNFTVVINNDIPFVSTDTMFIVHLNTTAPAGGNVLYGGSSPVSERGIFYSTEQEPEKNGIKIQIGEGLGSYSTLLTGLVPLTKYYIKAYAVNSSATVYGQEITFNSGEATVFKTIIDIEGNIYNYVTIGTQAWFAENLKTTKFNDGTPIPLVTDNSNWESLSTPGYCYMNNDSASYRDKYGALYNGWAVNTGKICPVGWHVPTDSDWSALEMYLGGSALGVQLRSLSGWDPNPYPDPVVVDGNGYNTSGFNALPGGARFNDFGGKGYQGFWWITSSFWLQYISLNPYESKETIKNPVYDFEQYEGFSIRCIKD